MSGREVASVGQGAGQPAKIARGSRQMRHLAQSIVLEESGTSALVRAAMLITCLAAVAFLGWSAVTRVSEVAVTQGEVVPSGAVKTVQHLEGGIVAEVLVRDGDLVKVGQPLLRLSPDQATADLDQARARRTALMLRAERLRAFLEDREPDFAGLAAGFAGLAADQLAVLVAQRQMLADRLDVLQAQIDQKRAEVRLYEQQAAALDQQIPILEEIVAMRAELLDKGLQSKVVYLDNKRELARQQGERARMEAQIAAAREALTEAETRMAEQKTALMKEAVDELGAVTAELAQVEELIRRHEDRVARLVVVAPVRGLVQGLAVRNPGAVVPPGGLIADIVPVDEEMRVESRVSTRDIGHVAVGQPVTVKVATYDYARYGAIPGRVVAISPTTFLDDRNSPYYKATIVLDRPHVGDDPTRNRVTPGMTVQADIITGDKTLLEYLLKPIHLAVEQAFHER